MARKKSIRQDSSESGIDMGIGLDMALATKPSISTKLAFEPKSVVSISQKSKTEEKALFDKDIISEFIRDSLDESGGFVYKQQIIQALKTYGLDDLQINSVFEYGISRKYFAISSNNKLVKLVTKNIRFPSKQTQLTLEEKVSYKQRKTFPDSAFAWPEKRKYLIHDASHARNAMVRLNAAYRKGYVNQSEYNRIRSRILEAYSQFGIKAKKPPIEVIRIKRPEKIKPELIKMAAEPCF